MPTSGSTRVTRGGEAGGLGASGRYTASLNVHGVHLPIVGGCPHPECYAELHRTIIASVVDCGTLRCVPSREAGLPLVALVPLAMQDPIDCLHDASASLSGRFEQELAAHRERLAAQYPESTSHCWRTLGLVGAGVMGTAIAATALRHGLAVMATDVSEALLTSMADRVAASFSVPTPSEAGGVDNGSEALARLQTTARLADLAAADLVIESVIEDPAVKGALYLAVEPHLAAGTLLASNTSTVRSGLLAQRLASPGRFCGLHFFYPVHDRPLVEVIAGRQTAPATVAAAVDFARRIGKIPLPVGDGCGFVVNRLLQAYLGEALQLLMEGVSPQDIDQAAEQFGMACGPLRMLDEIGLDTALHCAWIFAGAFPQIVPVTPLLVAMV